MSNKAVGKKMVMQGFFPLVLISCSLAYVARLFSFEGLGPEWGGLLLVLLFAALAAKTAMFISGKRRFEDDVLMGFLVVLAVKALGQALSWGVCGAGNLQTPCGASFQGLEFLAFGFLAIYLPPLWVAGFALYAGLLEMGYVAGPSVLHAAADIEVVMAGAPLVFGRLAYDLAFGVALGYFVRYERETRQDAVAELQRITREAKSFRLEEVVAKPEAGLEAMSRAGREDAELRAVSRLREKEANIARFLKQSLSCYSAAIFRFDPVSETLELRAWRSDSRNVRASASVRPGEGVIGWIFNKRESLTSGNNFKPVTELPYYASDEEILSVLGYPIVDPETDRALGVIVVDSREMDVLKDQHYSTLEMASRMLVEAVRNEEARSRQETEALQLQAMLELSRQMGEELDVGEICRRVILNVFRIVPYRVAAIVLWDAEKEAFRVEHAARADSGAPVEAPEWGTLEFGPDTESAVVRAMRQDGPFLVANYRQRDKAKRLPLWAPGVKLPDVDTILAVPLKRVGENVGCLVMGAEGHDVFEETERRLFGILSSLIGASLLNAQKHRATEARATTDALTQLANRAKFREFFTQQVAVSKRSKQPLSLLLLDLDHFKLVNDTYGHPAGDAVLKQMADILREQCRESDLPARYGGEEFIVGLVGTPRKDATRTAERIRKAVAGHAFELPDGRTIRATVSIGAATFPDDTTREDELTEKADQALYGAKTGGRNRVQRFCDLPDREGTTSWAERPAAGEPVPPSGSKTWRF